MFLNARVLGNMQSEDLAEDDGFKSRSVQELFVIKTSQESWSMDQRTNSFKMVTIAILVDVLES